MGSCLSQDHECKANSNILVQTLNLAGQVYMYSKIHSGLQANYIKAAQPVIGVFKMAEYFSYRFHI